MDQIPFVQPLHPQSSFQPSFLANLSLFFDQAISFLISSFFLSIVVLWACLVHIFNIILNSLRASPSKVFHWDQAPETPEKVTKEVAYYARAVGFDIQDETVETEDGFYLRMHKVINPRASLRSDGRGRSPLFIVYPYA